MTLVSTSIQVGVKPDEVWPLLVAQGRHDWYYRLTPSRDFESGARIEWRDGRGEVLEETEVIEVEAPRRLVLRSRYLFAPRYVAADPHRVTWTLEPSDAGTKVMLAWDAEGPALKLFASDAEGIVQSLRLAADPSARADLERLPEIGHIEVRDVTPERIHHYHRFFDEEAFRDYPVWQSCYCIETHLAGDDDEERTAADNRRDMTELIHRGQVTGLLAFDGERPVGWCNYGQTTQLGGLAKRFKLDAADHEGVGSIGCFVISSQYRGHGVASKLLDAAVDRLRAKGLRAVEAYPSKTEHSAQGNYRGPLEMYVRAGFEPYRQLERYVVMRKVLA